MQNSDNPMVDTEMQLCIQNCLNCYSVCMNMVNGAQQAKSHGVTERREHPGQLRGLVLGQRGGHQWGAAHATVELDQWNSPAGHRFLHFVPTY